MHKGCIPSKALLRSAEVYRMANKTASEYGVDIEGVTLQFDKVQARKQAIVEQLSQGVNTLMKKRQNRCLSWYRANFGSIYFLTYAGTISVEMSMAMKMKCLCLRMLSLQRAQSLVVWQGYR